MEYTDQELINWWVGLTQADQRYLLETMCEKMEHSTFAKNLWSMYISKISFSPRQLAAIRKWDY